MRRSAKPYEPKRVGGYVSKLGDKDFKLKHKYSNYDDTKLRRVIARYSASTAEGFWARESLKQSQEGRAARMGMVS